jgi:hypothetical protein
MTDKLSLHIADMKASIKLLTDPVEIKIMEMCIENAEMYLENKINEQ